ncbi:MAG TPA: hypothetical protein VIJ61_05610, partial [Thermoanaerobaculia bacterium]
MRAGAILLLALPALAQTPAAPSDPTLWPEAQRAFLQDGPGLLLTLDQRETFVALDEAGRDAYIGEMLGRDPIPETPANELVDGIARRRRLVAAETQTLLPLDARAQLLFLRGRPAERVVLDCAAIFKPMEIWTYPGDDGTPRDLVVYQPSSGEPFIQWLPIDSKRALYISEAEYWLDQAEAEGHRVKRIDRFFCRDSSRVDKATGMDGIQRKQSGETAVSRWDLRGRSDDTLQDFRWARPRERAAFLAAPADLATWARAAAATPLPAEPAKLKPGEVSLDFPYWQGQRLTVRALIPLPSADGMATVDVDGKPRVRLALDGVLDSGGAVFETFRLRYQVPPPGDASPALLFERALRPGQSFVLRLRLRDETSGAVATVFRGFRVPAAIQTLLPATATAAATGGETLRANVVGSDSLLLLPAPSEVVLNTWEAQTVVTGSRIAKVVFLVDGQPQFSRTRPPYVTDVRLAAVPREQVVRAEGYDAGGALVAWDQVVLNQARGGFRVLITDPRRGTRSSGKVLAHAEVIVPEDHKVAEV